MEYNIKIDILRAALECASNEEVGYYLMGVCLDNTGYVVATDGHVLFAARNEELTQLPYNVIIGKDVLKLALGFNKKSEEVSVEIGSNGHFIKNGNIEIKFNPIDFNYPDWKKVIPTNFMATPKREAFFNQKLLSKFQKISKLIGSNDKVVDIHVQDESDPAPISFSGRDDCIGVIMPMRHYKSEWKGLPQ